MTQRRILVVEDDPETVGLVRDALAQTDYEVSAAATGEEALEQCAALMPDLVILDINLDAPGHSAAAPMDGIEVLRELRKDSDVCVLMLTATSISYVKVAAFSVGADDYLTKPFDPKELQARVEAILRRARGAVNSGHTLDFKRLRIDPGARLVFKDGEEVKLTPIEFELLHTLARRPGQALHRGQLIASAWDYRYTGDERLVDVHMGRLRKKIEDDPVEPKFILTVWGKGYRFEADPA